jgi:multidrug efflux pump subunit AcrB
MIPKQYNPDIPVPAFNIIVPAPWFSAKEVRNLVVEPLEDKIAEIRWIDHIYWVSNRNFWVVTAQFKVWFDKEDATTLLYNKIFENLWNKPLWVQDPIIKKMDPDDFPVYTFAITFNNSTNTWESLIKLRKIATDVANKLKFVEWTSMFYLVGGYEDNLNIILDLDKLKWKNIDIMQVYQAIKNNNIVFPSWELKLNKVNSSITIDWNLADLDKLKKLIIWNYNWKPIYLQEVATIFKWVPENLYYTYLTTNEWENIKQFSKEYDAVFIWIAKTKWVNAVSLTKKIKK